MADKQALNPYLPSFEYIADGEPHVFDGRVYIYGSHDSFGGKNFCEKDSDSKDVAYYVFHINSSPPS